MCSVYHISLVTISLRFARVLVPALGLVILELFFCWVLAGVADVALVGFGCSFGKVLSSWCQVL